MEEREKKLVTVTGKERLASAIFSNVFDLFDASTSGGVTYFQEKALPG
jgi:hypothetical protein